MSFDQFHLEMAASTWQLWCFAVMVLAMAMAVETDTRECRIPNVLVLFVLVSGVTLNVLGPVIGRGTPFGLAPSALGAGDALLGVLVGFALFLPMYMLRAMGAGDVKLMAALGAFAGPVEVIGLGLTILVAGGVLAVVRMLWTRQSRRVLSNMATVFGGWYTGERFDPATQSVGRMPYALAFALGLSAYSYWRFSGGAPLGQFLM